MKQCNATGVIAPRRQAGFTLIEIMIVVVIIGLLAAAIVPNLLSNVDKAGVAKPDSPMIKTWRDGGYLPNLPKDPWKNDYMYVNPGTHGTDYDVYSLGADGQPGGEKVNADVGNWNLDQ